MLNDGRPVDEHREKERRSAMRDPSVIGIALDDDLAWLQSCFSILQNQARISTKQADDVQSGGFVHRGMPALILDVLFRAEAAKQFPDPLVQLFLRDAARHRLYDEPAYFHSAHGRRKHHRACAAVGVIFRIQRL